MFTMLPKFKDKVQWLTTEITTGASSGSRTGLYNIEMYIRTFSLNSKIVYEQNFDTTPALRTALVRKNDIAVLINKANSTKDRISVKEEEEEEEEEEEVQRREDRDKTRQVERSSAVTSVTGDAGDGDGSKTRVPWPRLSPTTIAVL
ncbi:hypothetical protein G5I_09984 [Acromyrmex echinatior]|uniref:Uncharacterized protein n=1 Tax=Acromyrmex echinatior TaxID=103372 RepID=F4WVN6_ACREC|nr:hypothetical protein G5I_09984 [Acromyrmex echinatior]